MSSVQNPKCHPFKLHRQKGTPNSVGGRKSIVNVPDTSHSSYGTVTDKVRHHRNCSIRTFYVDLFRGAHKNFIQELPMSIPERLSYKHWGGFQQNLHKISSQGPGLDHVRTPSGFHQDIFKSFSRGPVQDHAKAWDSMPLVSPQNLRTRNFKNFGQISMPGPLRESYKIVGSYKILIQEPSFIQAPLQHGICKLLMPGPLREDLTRISTRSSVRRSRSC